MPLNKSDLVKTVSSKLSTTGTTISNVLAGTVIDAALAEISAALVSGQEVRLSDFGSFKPKDKAARNARNPQTGLTVAVPAKRVVKFVPASVLKLAVNTVTK